MVKIHKRIRDLSKIDRPREKLQKYGPERLSSSELLAIILGTGIKGTNVIELSNKILKKFGGDGLSNASISELKKTLGLGTAKASEIVACFELGRRLLKDKKSTIVMSPKDVWLELKDVRDLKREHFVIFFLNTRNQEIEREIISIGSLNANLVHPREVFEPAIKHLAAHVILAHNHPSGDTNPSDEDLLVTKQLVDAGKLLGIAVLDHIIVSNAGYYSFASEESQIFDGS